MSVSIHACACVRMNILHTKAGTLCALVLSNDVRHAARGLHLSGHTTSAGHEQRDAHQGSRTLCVEVLAVQDDAHQGSHTPMCRVGHNRIFAPYMTVCMVISLLKIPYVHRIYL